MFTILFSPPFSGPLFATPRRRPWVRRGTSMESAELAERLEKTQRAVAEGEAHIRRQRNLIARLEEAGDDTSEARALLKTLLKRQAEREQNLALAIQQSSRESL